MLVINSIINCSNFPYTSDEALIGDRGVIKKRRMQNAMETITLTDDDEDLKYYLSR